MKRRRLSFDEKYNALDKLDCGWTVDEVALAFRMSTRSVRELRLKRNSLPPRNKVTKHTLSRKAVSVGKYPQIETKVVEFVVRCRRLNFPVTRDAIRFRAEMERDKMLLIQTMSIEERRQLLEFRVSDGWCSKFLKRHQLKSKVIYGQAGSAEVEKAKSEMAKIRVQLGNYDPSNIFNVDETALFYRLLPRRTYVLEGEDEGELRGTKKMKCKDRVTALLCANATGTSKVPISIIGASKNPRALKNSPNSFNYMHSKKAWLNTHLFEKWLHEVFSTHIRKHTTERIALLVDNASSHQNIVYPKNMDVIRLPPNVTSVHQPMDMGTIRAWKVEYRRIMLRSLLNDIETIVERKQANKNRTKGLNGIQEGYDANMHDVCLMSKKAWDNVSSDTIKRCWVRSHCLPCVMEAEISQSVNTTKQKCSNEQETELLHLFKRFRLHDVQSNGEVSSEEADSWISVEDNDESRVTYIGRNRN